MVTKRYLDDSDQDPHQPTDKRMRPAPTRPSLASVIGEVVMVKNLQNLFSAIEPLLRRVVREEVERVMRHICGRSITRSPSLRIELEAGGGRRPRLELRFTRSLCLPIFTGSRIVDMDGKPMQVVLVDKTSSSNIPALMRVEVVVVDGDFGGGEREEWTSEEFNDHIVRERRGKRPLLVASGGGGGEVVQNSSSNNNNNNNNNNNSSNNVSIIMRDGIGYLSGDIEFTDNSSWIRSRKFRVGVRVIMMPSSSTTDDHLRIREGITEPFVVKDHRGELYKKHHPPMLEDEVWRLEKIGKDGAFHKKLSSQGINTVQEFLKLSVVDPHKLRKILGIGMSDKMWEVTLKHARNCEMGKKVYIYRGPHFALFLNPICQLVRADINGQIILASHLNNVNRSYIDKLVREAYASWNTLEEVEAEGLLNDNISLLITRGEKVEQIPDDHNFGDKSRESYGGSNNDQLGCSEWSLNPTLLENIANVPFGFSPHNIATPSTSASASASGSITHSDGPAKWH